VTGYGSLGVVKGAKSAKTATHTPWRPWAGLDPGVTGHSRYLDKSIHRAAGRHREHS